MEGFFANLGGGIRGAGQAVAGFFRGIFDWLRGKKSREVEEPSRNIPTPRYDREVDEVSGEDFIVLGEWLLTPQSSNVYGFQYDRDKNILTVGYIGGWGNKKDQARLRFYEYLEVTEHEARGALLALSKGGWVWNTLRQRGTKFGYQKNYSYSHAENDHGYQRKKPSPKPGNLLPNYFQGAPRNRGRHGE